MANIAAVLDRLVREATRVDPALTLRPETPERIAAAEKCTGGSLPPDYREFLERVGRVKWPHAIGNVVDHRAPSVPARLVPFGRRDGHVFDRAVFIALPTPDDERSFAIEWCDERGALASGTPAPQSFADWLDAEITLAIVPASTRRQAASIDEGTEQTRRLLEVLVEAGAIEVVEAFDEVTAALQLAPFYGDSEKFHAELLECPGIEEVFLSEDDLEIRFDTSTR